MTEKKVEQNKSEQEVTPEEKLFRLIAAAGKDDAELQDLLSRYAQPKLKVPGTLRGIRDLVPYGAPLLRSAVLVLLGALTFYFLSGIRPGATFYISPGSRLAEVGIDHATDFFPNFFSDPRVILSPQGEESARSFASLRMTSQTPAGNTVSGVTVPAKEVRPYRLVGISWDEQGPVAMIETSEGDRAKFARKGDTLSGNVKIEDIHDYTVTLSSGMKKWELT